METRFTRLIITRCPAPDHERWHWTVETPDGRDHGHSPGFNQPDACMADAEHIGLPALLAADRIWQEIHA